MLSLSLLLVMTVQPSSFVLNLAVSPETPEGRRLIAVRAIEFCRGKYPVLGRYTFAGTEQVSGAPARDPARFTVTQELVCSDTAPLPPQGTILPEGWQPGEAETRQAVSATQAYFAVVDAGDVVGLERMMKPEHRATSSSEERAARLREFLHEAGAPGQHRIAKVTWYVNPPGVAPGAYAAVDFERTYANLAISCGYVAWHRQADGTLLLVREEIGSAPKGSVPNPAELSSIRATLRCVD